MSAPTATPQLYEFDVNGHTYAVCFVDNMHAHIAHGHDSIPIVLYLKRFIPESLHMLFLKEVLYIKKEWAIN